MTTFLLKTFLLFSPNPCAELLLAGELVLLWSERQGLVTAGRGAERDWIFSDMQISGQPGG